MTFDRATIIGNPCAVGTSKTCVGASLVKQDAQKAFLQATGSWGLNARHQRALLFGTSVKKELSKAPLLVFDDVLRPHEEEVLLKIAEILDVFLLGRRAFKDDIATAVWMNSPSKELCFCDISPLTLLVYGGEDGVARLKKHLGGLLSQIEGSEPRFKTVRSEMHEKPFLAFLPRRTRSLQGPGPQPPKKIGISHSYHRP